MIRSKYLEARPDLRSENLAIYNNYQLSQPLMCRRDKPRVTARMRSRLRAIRGKSGCLT